MYEQILKLPVDGIYMEGKLMLPAKSKSLVIFVQGPGQDHNRHRVLAQLVQRQGFGTLLINLSDDTEREPGINLLAQRLIVITVWIANHSEFHKLDLGYLASGTGAAIALKAAAEFSQKIRAIVLYGGRTDLVFNDLRKVISPTLLIAGELDFHAIDLNRKALKRLGGSKQLAIIAGASHLFEEPGKFDQVAKDTVTWYKKYMKSGEPVSEEELDSSMLEYNEKDYL